MFWKKKKSRKNTYKNNVFPRYVDKMAGEFGMVESRINTECLPFVRGDESVIKFSRTTATKSALRKRG